ncbi:helix-turn-helix domain-containing protein [Candidatus Poribacteria bacterium]|nr:helix-turn-helix domain-containing protein [Candidatus Poribacteria bacterium]
MAERFLTLDEAANRLDVSNEVIRKWLRSGRLKGVKAGRLWRIKECDLEKFLEETSPLYEPEVASKREEAKESQLLREYTYQGIHEFLKADRISPEVVRKLERLLNP